ncbi:MAG TPA: MazG nucleotide pyrophosphohydrolase domain-containing protein [Candidatus Nanoarchaeia archaeon]|nr:MazG nucleotide pyrophosphohydrolase domain-containing protein [Candidatus Nanoarchaeia archaeon]
MSNEFSELRKIVHELRSKCPWDKEQTLDSLKNNIVEEAEELKKAIETDDKDNLKEEIGDVILVALMLAEIAEEKGILSVEESLKIVSEKMKRRHPHVFGDAKADTAEEALRLFHDIKIKEKNGEFK